MPYMQKVLKLKALFAPSRLKLITVEADSFRDQSPATRPARRV